MHILGKFILISEKWNWKLATYNFSSVIILQDIDVALSSIFNIYLKSLDESFSVIDLIFCVQGIKAKNILTF